MNLLNYPGSKANLSAEIIGMMPKHRSYLEPFFGSGAVFFRKEKRERRTEWKVYMRFPVAGMEKLGPGSRPRPSGKSAGRQRGRDTGRS